MNPSAIQNSWSASRLPVISTWRYLNTSLDTIFYDTSALSREEQFRLSEYSIPEGHILIVYPRPANRPIRCLTGLEFVEEQLKAGSQPVKTIAVAGVGSSALGTASLARDIANYLGEPVAGIVSGLGLSDVVAEAAGGWLIFGFCNTVRDALARMLDFYQFKDHVRDQATHDDIRKDFEDKGLDPEFFIYGSPDSTALLYLLSKLRSKIKLLVGHSKGNYSIENALEGFHRMTETSGLRVPAGLQIVTLGAVIWFPPEFQHVHQFIGAMDTFGMMNSRLDLNCVPIPGAWHSLNKLLPGHMSVSDALRQSGIPSGGAPLPLRGARVAAAVPRASLQADGEPLLKTMA